MQIEQLTAAWLSLGIKGDFDRKDPFLRFIAVWLAFNSIYAEAFQTIDGDRRQVLAFASDEQARESHRRLVDTSIEYVDAIAVLSERGVHDVRSGRKRTVGSHKVLTEVLECVYQVRCNLIHGGKHLEDPRDRDLAHAAYVVVANLVSVYSTGPVSYTHLDVYKRQATI